MKYIVYYSGKESSGRREFDCPGSAVLFVADKVREMGVYDCNNIRIELYNPKEPDGLRV